MSARTYRRKPYDVQAIQWDGSNAAELAEFTGGDFEPEDGSPYDKSATGYLFTGESYDQKGRYLHTGDWVIRNPTGGPCQVVDADFFREVYELAEDTTETEA
ncbi:hypothetical protein [Nocardia sp. CA-290969]|uniref:hypothetical protein n=1 Tax=Nocardia sp. CA-290969 TaxID=3239986 RepID=UPI003D910DEC